MDGDFGDESVSDNATDADLPVIEAEAVGELETLRESVSLDE